ncbi:MAG: DNA polymerase III subunit gamma/tau, partial [Candidatus Sericytochromatia bacterium]
MKHLALYRKWRPQRFMDVVGQEHISRTLLNSIRQDRLAHAYLFCGPRGTGKTTSARLLAKALNCSSPVDGEPCNACSNCEEITAGHSLDVIEIDAASNRGIDSARDLREQVRFTATGGRYRVFIIDEFHMLTKEAFNALLKTLEEPPENVIFVLATTEPHEVLPTVVSRCQRFDFQRISTRAMSEHLQKVAAAEQIGVSAAAIEAMARKANGGLRDGLSLLDQVRAVGLPGEPLPDSLVYQSLGLVQEDELLALLQAAFAGEIEAMLANLRGLLEQGHDAMQIVAELIQLLRHLSLASLSPERLEQ